MRFKAPEGYQIALLLCAGLVALFTLLFAVRELRPEYKNYQKSYVDLEKFRSEESGEPPSPYKIGVKQILIQDQKVGPERIDRCISCHTALNLPHFSPTRPLLDINGNLRRDRQGNPILVENEEYIFTQLDKKIAELKELGEEREARQLERLRFRKIGGREIDLSTVLVAHPLIGQEIRPFQYHPIEQYGCTACHGGNGRSVRAERAHGPVFDGHYQIDAHSPISPHVEIDMEHDPQFAQVFNSKPGHDLLFQTTPLFVDGLMEARCLHCHLLPQEEIEEATANARLLLHRKQQEIGAIEEGLSHDKEALLSLLGMRAAIQENGVEELLERIDQQLQTPQLSPEEIDSLAARRRFIAGLPRSEAVERIDQQIGVIAGTHTLIEQAEYFPHLLTQIVDGWVAEQSAASALSETREVAQRMGAAIQPLSLLSNDPLFVRGMADHASRLLGQAERGRELYFTQGCYACHRIDGLSRGQVGPNLTEIGLTYPWYVKLSIVWPQGKLPSSAMPNFRLDHDEVEELMAFLMAQTNDQKAVSAVNREVETAKWEAGQPMPWERPIAPSNITNLDFGMTLFATEGCASCHKLHGFTSKVKTEEPLWFRRLIPEHLSGQEIAEKVHRHAQEIDRKVTTAGRSEAILEKIEADYPGTINSYYTNFKVASRMDDSDSYQERLHRILMAYVQEYGLGREIGPRLSWSGLFRDDEWLMGHFHSPSAHTAKSIMPVMPFDDSKFHALNFMLHQLARQNRDALHELWRVDGYQPALAYQLLCSACHGTHRQGDGVIAQWLYPIPKNLRNATFLRNLTKEQAIESIAHGVSGTPMPPWGETRDGEERPLLTKSQIEQLVDWLYASLPGQTVIEEEGGVQKWQLTSKAVVDQLCKEEGIALPIGFDQEGRYIKRESYTAANLEAGRILFIENCSHCHGTEGEGNGVRAERMVDAKPRMLSNLSWIQTRDDLRLLQSIQFGVPGTSMTPWGDQTSTLQRLQLVMYIRTLSKEREERATLNSLLFRHFDRSVWMVEQSRIASSHRIEQIRSEYQSAVAASQHGYGEAKSGKIAPEVAAATYQREVELAQQLALLEAQDQMAVEWIEEIRREREIYNALGQQLMGARLGGDIVEGFFRLLSRHALGYLPCAEEAELSRQFDCWIAQRQQRVEQLNGKIWDPSVEKERRALIAEIGKVTALKTNLTKQLRQSERSQQKQSELNQAYVRPQNSMAGDLRNEVGQIGWIATSPGSKPLGEERNSRDDHRSWRAPPELFEEVQEYHDGH